MGFLAITFPSCSRPEVVNAGITRTYAKTGMAQALSVPGAENMPNPELYFHRASATWYQNVAKGAEWVQRWWQAGLKGEPVHVGESRGTSIEPPLAL